MTLLRCKPIIDFSIVKGVTTMSLFDIVFPFLSGALSSMASPRFAQGKLKKLHVNIIGNKLNKPACPHCSMLRLRSRTFQHLDVLSLKQELSRIIRMSGFPKRSAVLSASWFLISATLLLLNRCINAHNTRHYFSSSFISPCLRQFHSFRNISHELICSTVFFEVETAPNPLAGVAVVQPGLESKNNIKQIHAKGRRLLNTPGSWANQVSLLSCRSQEKKAEAKEARSVTSITSVNILQNISTLTGVVRALVASRVTHFRHVAAA